MYKYFRVKEFVCNCGCGRLVKPELIQKLDEAREIAGVQYIIPDEERDFQQFWLSL